MVNRNNSHVCINVDKSYFEKVFEPERKRLQKKWNINQFTQRQFTAVLAKSKINIKYPKLNNKFMPRRKRGFSLI